MSASKPLPPRPSLDSLRKQAKKLSRDRSLSLRDAQLALAREYGFAGWRDLTAEVSKRIGKGLEWALGEAHRAIHDNDIVGLKQLIAEHPAVLSWQGDDRHQSLIGMATGAYGDAFGPEREHWFTRGTCAELLIDAGAFVSPQVAESILRSRAVGLLHMFERKGLLPRTLRFFSALGNLESVRAALHGAGNDRFAITEAFMVACRFKHEAVASLLLERSIALDPELGRHIDGSVGRTRFIHALIEKESVDLDNANVVGPWKVFVMGQVQARLQENDKAAFVDWWQRQPWLLADTFVWFQNRIIEIASYSPSVTDREEFIVALLDRDPAILHRRPPPPSQAIEHAITYGNTHLIPLLNRIWPLPDDLPHAAGVGNLERVKQWFAKSDAPEVQQVLDTALAFAVINRHFDVADVLLEHGANINTDWNSHEPASILHHLVFLPNPHESMQYLIDRGIDMTIEDYRWKSTAKGWAKYALQDEQMVRFLEDAERTRTAPPL